MEKGGGLSRGRVTAAPTMRPALAWDYVFGMDETTQTRCQHLLSLSASSNFFYDFIALSILYEISQFIIVERLFPF